MSTQQQELNAFQQALHKLRNLFLNGEGRTRQAQLLAPFVDYLLPAVYQPLLRDMICCAAQAPDSGEKKDLFTQAKRATTHCTVGAIAEVLATGHRVLATWIAHNGAPGKRRNVPLPRPFDEAHYVRTDAWYRLPVVRLVRTLRRTCRKYLAHAFIHGSYATEDYKADWSDLDTLVVLRAEVACSSALLRTFRIQAIRMRRYLYMVDSLQHHGHIVLSETDFEYYPESFFPTVLFAYTIPVFASERIQVTQRPGNAEAATAYEDLLQYLRHTDLTAITANLFAYKLFLHIVQLIPVAALQARGEQVYKRESFAKARPLASAVAWAAITEASRVRSTWDYRGWCSNGIGRTLVELLPNPQPLFALNLVFNTGLTLTQKQEAAVILRAARQLAEELSPS